jgi:sugar/nucleoside kinase (ribokinase family)
MKMGYDVLGAGIGSVDDLFYVATYPPANCKVPITSSARCGGGPACTAIAAVGSLQGRAAYVARFGTDDASSFIRSELRRRDVDISHVVHDPDGGPYRTVMVVDESGNRMALYDASRYRVIGNQDLADTLIQSASVFLLDYLSEPAPIELAERVRRLGVPILGDVEARTESALCLAELIDYLIVPEDFATWASGESNPRDACAFLARTERLATVVTCGAQGSYFSTKTDNTVMHVPAFAVEVFDTTGCGDVFHGAFALAVARGLRVKEATVFASAAAALKGNAAGGKARGWEAIPQVVIASRTRCPHDPGAIRRGWGPDATIAHH